jgi:hypothetical protein
MSGAVPAHIHGRGQHSGPLVGHFVTFSFSGHDLVNNELSRFYIVAPFDMRVVHAQVGAQTITNDPTWSITFSAGDIVTTNNIVATGGDNIEFQNGDQGITLASGDVVSNNGLADADDRNIPKGSLIEVRFTADADDALVNWTFCLTCFTTGHVNDSSEGND